MTPKILGAKLAERANEFVRPLLPDGQEKGGEWCVGSVKGEAGESCKIHLTTGLWKDWSTDEPGGDLLDLYAAVKGISLSQAMRECAKWLGIDQITWGKRKQRETSVPEKLPSFRKLSDVPEAHAWCLGRGFSEEVIAKYRLFADIGSRQVDGKYVVTGTAANIVFPYILAGEDKAFHLKFRDARQKQVWTSKNTRKGLYGWHALDRAARTVILVEGEPDVLAAATYGFPQVLGIPNGGGGGKMHEWIETEWDDLMRFDTIYLAIESDGAGMTAIHELVERLGRERCRVVKLPYKDINKCLQQGVEKTDIVEAISAARTLDPEELRNAGDFTDAVIQRFHPIDKKANGFHAPWASLLDRFYFAWGETTVLAGYTGHGKTELTGQIVLDASRQGIKCCVASMEFKADKWLQRTTRQAALNPDPSPSRIRQVMGWISNSIWVVDTYGTAPADRLLKIFEYAYRRYGVRLFVVDNWSKLGIADDDLSEQKRVINAFAAQDVRLNTHTIIVHHFRKAENDFDRANKMGLKGSSSIGDMACNILIVRRNRQKEQAMESPDFTKMPDDDQKKIRQAADTWLSADKARNFDEEFILGLYFDKTGHVWTEGRDEPPPVYVPMPKVNP
jgi:twinkle protein